MAVGAYSIAMGVVAFGWSFWLALFVGMLAAVVLALILGIPTLRLRADYLAIVTIAAGEILRLGLRAATFRESRAAPTASRTSATSSSTSTRSPTASASSSARLELQSQRDLGLLRRLGARRPSAWCSSTC